MYRHNLNFIYAVLKRGAITYNGSMRIACLPLQASRYSAIRLESHRFYSLNNATCWSCQEPLSADLCIQFTCLKCKSLLQIPKDCVSMSAFLVKSYLQGFCAKPNCLHRITFNCSD